MLGRGAVGGVLGSFLVVKLKLNVFATYSSSHSSGPALVSPARFILGAPTVDNAMVSLTGSSSVRVSYSRPSCNFPTGIKCCIRITFSRSVASFARVNGIGTKAGVDVSTPLLTDALASVGMGGNTASISFPVSVTICVHLETIVVADSGGTVRKARVLSGMISLGGMRLLFSLPPIGAPRGLCVMNKFGR